MCYYVERNSYLLLYIWYLFLITGLFLVASWNFKISTKSGESGLPPPKDWQCLPFRIGITPTKLDHVTRAFWIRLKQTRNGMWTRSNRTKMKFLPTHPNT